MRDFCTEPDPDMEAETSACLNIFLIFIKQILIESCLPVSNLLSSFDLQLKF